MLFWLKFYVYCSLLVGRFINRYRIRWSFFAQTSLLVSTLQIAADMLGARASPAQKIPHRLRHRIYETAHLVKGEFQFLFRLCVPEILPHLAPLVAVGAGFASVAMVGEGFVNDAPG